MCRDLKGPQGASPVTTGRESEVGVGRVTEKKKKRKHEGKGKNEIKEKYSTMMPKYPDQGLEQRGKCSVV